MLQRLVLLQPGQPGIPGTAPQHPVLPFPQERDPPAEMDGGRLERTERRLQAERQLHIVLDSLRAVRFLGDQPETRLEAGRGPDAVLRSQLRRGEENEGAQ